MWSICAAFLLVLWVVTLFSGHDSSPVLAAVFVAFIGISAKMRDFHRRRIEEAVASAEAVFRLAKEQGIDPKIFEVASTTSEKEEETTV